MASTVWKGFLSFGLISIPIRLFRAARPERVNLRRLHRRQKGKAVELEPVREASVEEEGDQPLPKQEVVKGYEYGKGQFVAIEKEELDAIAARTTEDMSIQQCVELDEIDPVYFETSYYVHPEKAGEKAYGLLYRSLREMKLVGLAQFAMHNREHVVVLRPGKKGMLAHSMFYLNEVRAEQEYKADTHAVSAKELELAKTLIKSLAGPFEPEKYHDTYREKLEAILEEKAAGKRVTIPREPEHKPTKVVDIADALRQSLANLKKPPVSERRPVRAKKTRRAAAAHA
jgi:DNA end-binding protein Ku